ncbi:MAG: hypothetical protein KGS10_16165 [Chloroflexi bacterium]|nr:hypothetical protein [Chloroflexota bacterium]
MRRALDTRLAWGELRRRWQIRNPGETNRTLAAWLGASAQHCSAWSTGSDPERPPPVWAVLRLAEYHGVELRILPDLSVGIWDPATQNTVRPHDRSP